MNSGNLKGGAKPMRLVVFLLVTVLFSSSICQVMAAKSPKIGASTPQFSLKDINNKKINLSQFKGKVVLINFFNTYCGLCKKEMPYLQKFYQKYKKNGLIVLVVSLDGNVELAKKYAQKEKLTFYVLHDKYQKVANLYSVKAVPMTFLIGRDGKTRYYHKGYKKGDEKKVEAEIKTLLGEKK